MYMRGVSDVQPCSTAKKIWAWVKDYFGTIQLDPKEELKEIPNHSAFFILSPDNGSVGNLEYTV